MYRLLALLCAFILFAGCEGKKPEQPLEIKDSWARAVNSKDLNSAIYLSIRNYSNEVEKLVGVETSAAEKAQLHEVSMKNDVMKMHHSEEFTIPVDYTLELKPGGKHIMLTGLKKPLKKSESVSLKLQFRNAGSREISVPVKKFSPQ